MTLSLALFCLIFDVFKIIPICVRVHTSLSRFGVNVCVDAAICKIELKFAVYTNVLYIVHMAATLIKCCKLSTTAYAHRVHIILFKQRKCVRIAMKWNRIEWQTWYHLPWNWSRQTLPIHFNIFCFGFLVAYTYCICWQRLRIEPKISHKASSYWNRANQLESKLRQSMYCLVSLMCWTVQFMLQFWSPDFHDICLCFVCVCGVRLSVCFVLGAFRYQKVNWIDTYVKIKPI